MSKIIKEIQKWQQTEAKHTLQKCGLHRGMDVIDFGCGALYWTLPTVHFDEIEKHINQPELANKSFDELERRDIWVFKKV